MKRILLGSILGFMVLSFQNCSEPKLAFDHADHASALGVNLRLIPDPHNVKEVENVQDYTVEIVLPEKGQLDAEKITVDGTVYSHKKNALGNLEFNFTPRSTKDYLVKAEVWTPNGTRFEVSETLSIKDDLPPIVVITPLATNVYENKTGAKQEFSFTVTEQGGGTISQVSCIFSRYEGGALKYVTAPCNFVTRTGNGLTANPSIVSGTNTLTIRAIDSSGNFRDESVNFSVGADTLPPSLSVQAAASNTYYTKDVQQYTIKASDLGSGLASVICVLTSPSGAKTTPACFNNPVNGSQTISLSSLVAGNYILTVTATDNETSNPNKTVVSVTIPMKEDKTPPTIVLSKNASNSYLANEVQKVGFQISDSESGLNLTTLVCKIAGVVTPCTVDSKGIGEISFSKSTGGSYPVSVEVKDLYGNPGSNSVTLDIIKDNNAPVITITENYSNPSVPVTGNTLKFDFTIKKEGNLTPITSVVCKNDLGVAVTCTTAADNKSGSFSVTFNTAGQRNVSVTATDGAGNVSTKTYTVVIRSLNTKTTNLTVTSAKKLDVIIVIDNSGSMSEEQRNMATRISSFVDKLSGTDWRAAVITTDVNSTTTQGRFRLMSGTSKYFITASDANAQTILGNTVQGAGINGSATEQGIAASYYSIVNKDVAPNAGFFRADAGLSIIVISDENESASQTANSGDNLIATIKNAWSTKPFKFHSIVGTGTGCAGSYLGSKYIELSNKTGGEVACVAQADYSSTLAKIGVSTSSLVKSVSLECSPLNNKITVYNGSTLISTGYSVVGTMVTFDNALPDGSYKIDYSCIQ